MSLSSQNELDLKLLCDHFPKCADRIRPLILCDAMFRSTCEAYSLAWHTLTKFQRQPTIDWSKEIAEYQTLVGELRSELEATLQHDSASGARGVGGLIKPTEHL